MAWTKTKIVTVAGVIVLVSVTVPVVMTRPSANVVKGPDGRIAKLERYEFQTGRVRYELPPASLWQRLAVKLPDVVKKRMNFPKPVMTAIAIPRDPGEPMLSAAFSWQINSNYARVGIARLAVADDQGNEFDPVVQGTAGFADFERTQSWVGELPVFPRRGQEMYLRVMSAKNLVAEFKIPNPAPGPHPTWNAEPLPLSSTDGDLEATMAKFRAYQTSAETAERESRYPRTECVFVCQEDNRKTVAWLPVSFDVSDATGNHWRSHPDSRYSGTEDGEVRSGFLGALWSGESAWKIGVEFRRVAEFPESELLRISRIRVPAADEFYEPRTQYQWNGANVEVGVVIGTNVDWDRIHQFNVDRKRGCITVALTGRILSRNRRLTFLAATDQQGRAVNLAAPVNEPGIRSDGTSRPYSFIFEVPEGAQELNMVVAVSQSRFVEFLAKPEQIKE